MKQFTLSYLSERFPTDAQCLEEIKILRFPQGIHCTVCNRITKHYKIAARTAYACTYCRNHVYPLAGTIFEKTTTPLHIWFLAMLLLVLTRGKISAKKLQLELGVTYKTAWRMSTDIKQLMAQNNGDLLLEKKEVFSLSFFKTLEIHVVEKQQSS